MSYNPVRHHRRSIRLKGYDYSRAGLYFITICVQDRVCLFGEIENAGMILNDAGIIINKWWQKIPEKYPDIKLDYYQIMPNHFHAIIINNSIPAVRADPRVCPFIGESPLDGSIQGESPIAGSTRGEHNIGGSIRGEHNIGGSIRGEHMGSPLFRIVQWFKTMATNEYIRGVNNLGWKQFNGKLWQRNYWEHIIRNEQSYHRISEYIINNPAKWNNDKFNN
jgi:REP element-mobilizing transposase RayT